MRSVRQQSYFDTFKWTSNKSETTKIFVIAQSQKVLPAYTAHTLLGEQELLCTPAPITI
jgi:hypothetical protein